MKKSVSAMLVFGLLAALSGPVTAANNEVTVRFKGDVSTQFVKTLSQTFKAQATQVDKTTWRFQVPPLKTVDQFSELFASLPTVAELSPLPVYQVADHINPQAVNVVPLPETTATRSNSNYIPGEFLVKFKPGTTRDDMHFLNSHNQVSEISRIAGIDVYRLRVPQHMSIFEAIEAYQQSGIVEYAEPNFRMNLPTPVTPSPAPSAGASAQPAQPNNNIPNGTAIYTQIPLDGGGQMLINFRPQTTPAQITLFHQIYGTRLVRQESFYEYRIQLPSGLNPARAVRIFMLYPYITNAQRLYS